MTSKERMMRALAREKPDRLPVTIHQWQQYHLDTYLGGMTRSTRSRPCGLDASIQYFEAMGQFWIPNAEKYVVQYAAVARGDQGRQGRPGRQARSITPSPRPAAS